MNRIDLDGQHAIVTGAAQGFGRAIAERFLASGASVSIWDQDAPLAAETAAELKDRGAVAAVSVDVSDPAGIEAALQASLAALGPPDVLVNNAGIAGMNAKTWDYPVEEWRRVLAIDLEGVFLCCRAVVPGMIERGYGRIVNIASIAGKEGNPNASAYSAAKAGVIALTKSLGWRGFRSWTRWFVSAWRPETACCRRQRRARTSTGSRGRTCFFHGGRARQSCWSTWRVPGSLRVGSR